MTADSVMVNSATPGWNNCLSGLVDNKYYTDPALVGNNGCCASTASGDGSNDSWFNIKLTYSSVIQTLLLINREDTTCP